MSGPATHRSRPAVERLESIDLLSTVLPAYANLTSTPIATQAKTYIVASTPAQGRQRGTINALVAVPEAGDVAVAGVITLQYHVRIIPAILSPFYSPTVSFTMHINFSTSLNHPRPGQG